MPDANAPVPTIKQVVFSGLGVLSNADLQPVVAPYLNRPLTRGDLAKMKYDIAKRYYEDGYILVRVVTPPNQDLTRGVLNVTVYEAKIDKVDGGQGCGRASVHHRGDHLGSAAGRRVQRERRRIDGARSRRSAWGEGVGEPGAGQPGGHDGAGRAMCEKTNDFNQYVSVNNYGSKLTGEWLFNAGLQWGNLLGLGELYTLNFTHSNDEPADGQRRDPDADRDQEHHPGYELSVLQLDGRAGTWRTWARTGTTDQFRIGLSSALLNTAKQKITVRLGFDAGHFQSNILDGMPNSDDKTRHVTLDGNYLLRLSNTTVYAALQLSQGRGRVRRQQRGRCDC